MTSSERGCLRRLVSRAALSLLLWKDGPSSEWALMLYRRSAHAKESSRKHRLRNLAIRSPLRLLFFRKPKCLKIAEGECSGF